MSRRHSGGPASRWCAGYARWSGWVSSWWFSSGRWGPAHRRSPAGAVPAPPASGRPEPPRSGACQPCGDHLQSRLCGIGDRLSPGRSAWMGLLQAPVRRWPDAAEDTGEEVQTATGRDPITPDRGHSAQPGACRSGRGHSTPSGTAIPSPNT